jgi:DNA-directed RNA polymerase specialized sigma24 family protein
MLTADICMDENPPKNDQTNRPSKKKSKSHITPGKNKNQLGNAENRKAPNVRFIKKLGVKDEAELEQFMNLVKFHLDSLPDGQRDVLMAYFFERRSMSSIGRAAGVTGLAVGKVLSAGIDNIKCLARGEKALTEGDKRSRGEAFDKFRQKVEDRADLLEKLPADRHDILLFYYFDLYSSAKIAEIMGGTTRDITQIISSTRNDIHTLLSGQELGEKLTKRQKQYAEERWQIKSVRDKLQGEPKEIRQLIDYYYLADTQPTLHKTAEELGIDIKTLPDLLANCVKLAKLHATPYRYDRSQA